MPYSDHVKPVKTAVNASQLDGYEELLDKLDGTVYEGDTLTKADIKRWQSDFFRNLWAEGTWSKDGLYYPNWFKLLVFGHPTDNKLKQLTEDSLWFVDFVEEKLKAGQIVPILEVASLFKKRLEQDDDTA